MFQQELVDIDNDKRLGVSSNNEWMLLLVQDGLKIINQDMSRIMTFTSQDVNVIMDWTQFDKDFILTKDERLSFSIIYRGITYRYYADRMYLQGIREYCSSKFVFKRSPQMITKYEGTQQFGPKINIIKDMISGKIYREVVYGSHQVPQDLDESFNSQDTLDCSSMLPDEIRILQDCKGSPTLLKVDQILFNTEFLSYSYSFSWTNVVPLLKLLPLPEENKCSIILQYAYQLLKLISIFEEKSIIHNGIVLSNLFLEKETNDIILADYIQAFYLGKKAHFTNIGYITPEDMIEKQHIKSNMYRLGIVLYTLLVGDNPFAKNGQVDIHLNVRFIVNQDPFKKQDSNLVSVIKRLLYKDPSKRPSAKQLLTEPLFQPQYRERLSKHSLLQKMQQTMFSNFEDAIIDSEPAIQTVRSSISKLGR